MAVARVVAVATVERATEAVGWAVELVVARLDSEAVAVPAVVMAVVLSEAVQRAMGYPVAKVMVVGMVRATPVETLGAVVKATAVRMAVVGSAVGASAAEMMVALAMAVACSEGLVVLLGWAEQREMEVWPAVVARAGLERVAA